MRIQATLHMKHISTHTYATGALTHANASIRRQLYTHTAVPQKLHMIPTKSQAKKVRASYLEQVSLHFWVFI